MLIRYADQTAVEAILVDRTDHTMRVVLRGSEDAMELTEVNGTWVTEHCDPVQVEFAWQKNSAPATPELEECICSHDLASKLIHMLLAGESEDEPESPETVAQTACYAASAMIV